MRNRAILYTIGRTVLLLMTLLTAADLIYFYLSADSSIAIGMMISHMAVLLGSNATALTSMILCNAIAYVLILANTILAVLAGKHYAFAIAATVLISVDTIVAIWFILAAPNLGFLPSVFAHVVAELGMILAIAAGRKLCAAKYGVRKSLKLALFGGEI